MRDRYDLEVKAVAEFFGFADQVDKLNDKVAELKARQADVVVRLANEVGPARAAATVCWPVNRVREAIGQRTDRSATTNGASDE